MALKCITTRVHQAAAVHVHDETSLADLSSGKTCMQSVRNLLEDFPVSQPDAEENCSDFSSKRCVVTL